MTKATIVRSDRTDRLQTVPRESEVVLDFGDGPFDRKAVDACLRAGFRVRTLLAAIEAPDSGNVAGYAGQGAPAVLLLSRPATVEEALRGAAGLARPHLSVEVPLRGDDDLDVLKVLSSLGVRTRIAVGELRSEGDLVLEAMTDALVRMGRRTAVTPFEEVRAGRLDESFEIASLDFVANDHFVDLRGEDEVPGPGAWDGPDVSRKRVPFLRGRHPCAFCEGLLFCHGYLYDEATVDLCRGRFAEMMELLSAQEAPAGNEEAVPAACCDRGREAGPC